MLSGDNNILKRAGDAKDKTELESLAEEAKIVMSNRTIEKTTMGTNSKTLKQDLETGISGGQVEEITKADGTTKYTDVCYVTKNGKTITVYEDGEVAEGKVSIWKGTTDIECPEFKKDEKNIWNWYIYTAGQLKFLADFVNNGNKLDGRDDLKKLVEDENYDSKTVTMSTDTTIYLMNNLDLGARPGEANETLTDEIEKETSKWASNSANPEWTPISILICTFKGNNHSIRGVYVNRTGNYNGIFGQSMTIQNLTIKNGFIKGKSFSGGISGISFGTIEDCHNENTLIVSQDNYIGGILGMSKNIKKCTNNGNIIGKKWVGGICGSVSNGNTVSECNNNGKIKGENYIGGVVGAVGSSSIVSECNNNGEVEGKNNKIGGVIGEMSSAVKVEECKNSGQVTGKEEYTGGIVGAISTDSKDPSDKEPAIISKCYNSGNIQGNTSTGGVIGGATQYKSLIEKCYNLGEISGTGNSAGGIAGEFGRSSKIYNCYNMNKVTGINYVGGIAGNSYNSACEIKNCYNIGNISGTTKLGGILGRNSNSSTIENSYYLEGTATLDEGSGSANNLAKNKEFITQDFVTTANSEKTIWKVEAGKNDGWPILNE